ncbi:MFS transporter [Streptomyces sp. NPDC001595]|uniref:MFS transporter n=1 Tax=Streptomyces sp. NPDC001532 TaxID=3154520 RepID=UPI00332AC1B3
MTSTSASAPHTASRQGDATGWSARLVGVLVALIWPTQLLAAVGIIGANVTADVAQSFRTTQVAWFTLVVTLVSMLLTPFVIKLGDRYGKKRLMLAMTGLGVIGDVVAATAGSFWLLLVGRGIAACYGPFAALSFPAVRDIFPARLVKPASAILGSSVGLVGLTAPFVAGWLVDHHGYRGAMWFIAAATAVSFLLVALLVPQTPRHESRPGFDWLGGLTLGGGLTALVLAVSEGQSWGWGSPATLAWLGGGLAALVAFLFVERSSRHPILDLKVLGRRPVAVVVIVGGLSQAIAYVMPAMAILLALYPHIPGVSAGLGWTAQHNAVVGVTWNLVMFATGIAASRLLRGRDVRPLWWAGLLLMAAGYGLMGFFHGNELELVLTSCLANVGAGIVVAGAPVLVVGVVAPHEQGLGSGMVNMLLSLFGAVVNAVAFAVLAAHSTVMDGTAFYQDQGYAWVFWSGALLTLLALAISLFIPASREPEDVEATPAP